MEPDKFFHARSVDADELVLDCYRLAKYYGRAPDEFLSMSLSKIQKHMMWTSKLIEATRQSEDDD